VGGAEIDYAYMAYDRADKHSLSTNAILS